MISEYFFILRFPVYLKLAISLTGMKFKQKHTQSNLPKRSTSIKRSPVLKGHTFPLPSYNISYELNLFKEVTGLKWPLVRCLKSDLLIQV